MAAPLNTRQELFAQGLADGKCATDAYEAAGYKRNDGNAATLKADQRVSKRVDELLAERAEIAAEATEQAIESLALTKQWVLGLLMENAQRAMQAVEVKDSQGTGSGEYRYEGSVANRALELLGKQIGLFKEKVEHSGSIKATFVIED